MIVKVSAELAYPRHFFRRTTTTLMADTAFDIPTIKRYGSGRWVSTFIIDSDRI